MAPRKESAFRPNGRRADLIMRDGEGRVAVHLDFGPDRAGTVDGKRGATSPAGGQGRGKGWKEGEHDYGGDFEGGGGPVPRSG